MELSSPENDPSTAFQSTAQSSSGAPIDKIWIIKASSRHFEYCTRGVIYPRRNSSVENLSGQQPETDGVS
ncbi:hypothetical protein BGX26_009372, partial [Mortierella sp. AD094]